MIARRRRVVILHVEAVERRELMSTAFGLGQPQGNPAQAAVAMASLRAHNLAGGTVTTTALSGNSTLQGSGAPTPAEQARERFRAAFSGPAFRGPGRFTDQSSIQYIRGVGGSDFFLHGDMNLAFVTPVDPTQAITGEAVLTDKNNNNGAVLGLVLVADKSTLDRFGRPTAFTFSSDPNIYGGTFFTTTSSGTGTIHYNGNHASVSFAGQVYTIGLTNPLRNSDLYSKKTR